MTDMSFHDEGRTLTQDDLAREEQTLGRSIPPAYRTFLLEHNGGRPERTEFEVDGEPVSVKSFLSVDGPEETLDLDYVFSIFGNRIPPSLFPIARDPGGNLILLAVDGDAAGKVAFWDHEREADDDTPPTSANIHYVADNFDAFLAELKGTE